MKYNVFIFIILTLIIASCDSSKEEKLVLKDASLEAYETLEKSLNSEPISFLGNERLPKAFLPKDTSLFLFKKFAFYRTESETLNLSSRAFQDTLGNFILLYEWDKIAPYMTQSQKEKIKREFDKHHAVYVAKYNQLTDQLTDVFGPPLNADKKLQVSDLEVYKMYKSSQLWRKDNQIIELNLVMMPNELYRVIIKNLVFRER